MTKEQAKNYSNSPMLNHLCGVMDTLEGRWHDEKEYEDFKEYVNHAKRFIPTDTTFIKMNKKPFEIHFKKENYVFFVRVTSKDVGVYFKEVL